ncbi:MAG: hypothetical protein AAGB10_22620, partial [Pseudomonadota bacterium]
RKLDPSFKYGEVHHTIGPSCVMSNLCRFAAQAEGGSDGKPVRILLFRRSHQFTASSDSTVPV